MNRATPTIQRFFDTGVMAIIRVDSPANVLPAVEALAKGGIEFIEISLVTPHAVDQIAQVHDALGETVVIGAGTVLDSASARSAILAGADFIVSPTLRVETILMTRRYGKLSFAGAYSPTECLLAWESGSDAVKVFPAMPAGPEYLKAIHAPLPQIPLVVVGGVTLENMPAFFKAGARGVAVATSLADPKLIAAGAYAELTRLSARWLEAARGARQS
jgi:2-dehydro-3-deoxyphosphogluconate aldolase/(4S)-4-hydroxy-2-oxoglutarate aldolase